MSPTAITNGMAQPSTKYNTAVDARADHPRREPVANDIWPGRRHWFFGREPPDWPGSSMR